MADDDDVKKDDVTDDGDLREEGEEGTEGEEGGGDEQRSSSGGKKKLLLIIGGLFILLVGGSAGLYFTGMLDSLLGKQADEVTQQDGGHGEAKDAKKKGGGHGGGEQEDGEAAFLEIPTMIVNLNSPDDGEARYLRLSVQLELEDPADVPKVEAVIPRVVDQFQTYLRELRVSDLRGSAGIYRLQMELLWRVNQAAYPVKIKDVLFQEILIQ